MDDLPRVDDNVWLPAPDRDELQMYEVARVVWYPLGSDTVAPENRERFVMIVLR